LAFILRLIYLSHLKVNDPNFYQPAPGTDMLTYHNSAQQIDFDKGMVFLLECECEKEGMAYKMATKG
jgi:hypothetical protein